MTIGLAALVVACGDTIDPSPVATETVMMQDNEFEPSHISVSSGATVTWINEGQRVHDVAITGGERSTLLSTGEHYELAFSEPGVFDYVCTLHPGMVGRVTVE